MSPWFTLFHPECRSLKTLQDFSFGESAYERPDQKWVCGRLAAGYPCRIGPDGRGRCQATFECVPSKSGDTWICRRPDSAGGVCPNGPGPDGTCCNPIPQCAPRLSLAAKRARVVKWVMSLAIGFVAILAAYAGQARFLTPGPMTAAHSSLSNCGICHSNVADGKFDWLHTIFASTDPAKSADACLACHNMETTALNPHGLALDELERRTSAHREASTTDIAPMSLWIRDAVFATEDIASSRVFCTTCHKEHQGERFPLSAISNGQCQTCHAVQFTSFQDGHPDHGTYPFRRRTRLNYDHTKHFKVHFPETAKQAVGLAQQPDACGDCHIPGPGNRQIIVQPFEQMCGSCHLGQILGTDGAAESRGIALFSLPGLDLASLREKGAQIGSWPEDAYALETEMSPLLRLFVGSDAAGRELLAKIEKLNLLELESATAEDIEVVEKFIWQVKELIYAFATAKISDSELVRTFTAELDVQYVDQQLLTELTASIPLDVWTGALRDWLPDLAKEISLHRKGRPVPIPERTPLTPKAEAAPDSGDQANEPPADAEDGSDILGNEDDADILGGEDDTDILGGGDDDTDILGGDDDTDILGGEDDTDILGGEDDTDILGGDDTDILGGEDDTDILGGPNEPPKDETTEGDDGSLTVTPEEWAEFGGWYRQDFEIRYKPTQHSDRFVRSWLDFTSALMGLPQKILAEPVVRLLTKKGAPGQCAKCHSIDESETGALSVNWKPISLVNAIGQFTRFSHEPHFSIMDNRGCLTCHDLNPKADYAKSHQSYDPAVFESNFKPIEQGFCRECHAEDASGEDCQMCHVYHITVIDTRHMAHTTKFEVPDEAATNEAADDNQ
jgi:hypothetical protein